jgi:hypothetical protein
MPNKILPTILGNSRQNAASPKPIKRFIIEDDKNIMPIMLRFRIAAVVYPEINMVIVLSRRKIT